MAIVENKLKIIITIAVFLFTMIFIVGIINASYETMEFDYSNKTTSSNYSEFEEHESEEATGFIQDLIGGIFLQIDGAPAVINGIMAFVSGIMIFALVFTLIAYVRELVGFT